MVTRRAGRHHTARRVKQRDAKNFPVLVNGVRYNVHHNKFGYCAENSDGVRVTGNVANIELLRKELEGL